MILSRVPPQNVDAEKSVLGAMLLDKDAILMAEDKLTPEDFYREADAVIFKAILNLSHRGEPADILTVTEELKRMGRLDDVGGVLYINELPMNVISPKSVDRHADIVAGKAKLRRLIDAAGIIAEEAYSEQDAVEDITDNAEKSILEVTRDERKSDFTPIGEAVQNELEEISRKFRNKETITGIATGFPSLDALTSGFQKGDFIIVAARPSMGKTAFVLNMAKNMSISSAHKHVAFFSLEMSREQLVQRLLCSTALIDSAKLRPHFHAEGMGPARQCSQRPHGCAAVYRRHAGRLGLRDPLQVPPPQGRAGARHHHDRLPPADAGQERRKKRG